MVEREDGSSESDIGMTPEHSRQAVEIKENEGIVREERAGDLQSAEGREDEHDKFGRLAVRFHRDENHRIVKSYEHKYGDAGTTEIVERDGNGRVYRIDVEDETGRRIHCIWRDPEDGHVIGDDTDRRKLMRYEKEGIRVDGR